MYLYSYKINDVSLPDLLTWGRGDCNGNPPFVFADSLPDGYADVTSVENIDKYWELTNKDFKVARNVMATAAAITGWASLSTAAKTIAAKWLAVDVDKRTEIFTIDEQIEWGRYVNRHLVQARTLRFEHIQMELYNRLTIPVAYDILLDIKADDLDDKYIAYGLEGTLEGDGEGLFDYIESRSGTSYEFSGLMSKSITPIGMTLSELRDHAIDVLKNGNYVYE